MAPGDKPDKKYIRFSWEEAELQCEWRECNWITDQFYTYLQHVDNHLQIESEELECRWRECSGYSGNKMELTMHVLFHAFHTKIKCFGKNLLKRKSIGGCSFDQRARNVIPDIYEMHCYWDSCGVSFLSAETFYRHVDTHAEDNPKGNNLNVSIECKWQGCTSKFNSLYRLKEHMRCHTQERVMACPTCGSMFASRTKFFDHVKRQNASGSDQNEVTYQCGCCSRKLASERLLRDHMRHHINHYKCPYCDMTCPTPSGVRRHVLYRHNENKSYKCNQPQCNYAAKSVNDLRKHAARHKKGNSKNYCCEIEDCNFCTHSEALLNKHMKNVHNCNEETPSFMCHICQKSFTRGNYLTKHLVRVHQLRWPSGHCRFRYHMQEDGYYKLQTIRYESIELSDAVLDEDRNESDMDGDKNSIANENFSRNSNQERLEQAEKCPEKIVGLPVVVYMSSSELDNKSEEQVKTSGSLPVMELQATNENTYITPDGSSVVYVNVQQPTAPGSSTRTIQFVTKSGDGSTIIQTAEVIADGSQNHGTVQLL